MIVAIDIGGIAVIGLLVILWAIILAPAIYEGRKRKS